MKLSRNSSNPFDDKKRYFRTLFLIRQKLSRYYCYYNINSFLPQIQIALIVFLTLCMLLLLDLEAEFSSIKLSNLRIDWHDWELIEADKQRTGIGEQGEDAYLSWYPESSKLINDTYGYNGYLSDKIALDRSLSDLRPLECRTEKYSAKLPSVSVIIIFHNERLSALLRTVVGVWKRTPIQLLKEIILVDDMSTISELGDKLSEYIAANLPIVKLLRLKKRSGLIEARLIGARAAKSDILVFLDAHCEAYHNWLPPLLDAMDNDYRTVVLPTIDIITIDSFRVKRRHESEYARRGVFNWIFHYKATPLLPSDAGQATKPFETPIMAGGLFAISARFFWEIGGYDEGLRAYGGEQFEISFKIWLCGGRMLETACSRVGHIYRSRPKSVYSHMKTNYVKKNYKRVAEVWMDEYKDIIYNAESDIYNNIDPGDLRKPKQLRERLQCKSFKWFMENVAFDLLEYYPIEEIPSFVQGAVRNIGLHNFCVDTMSRRENNPLGIYHCGNLTHPQFTQDFRLTFDYNIRDRFDSLCWLSKNGTNAIYLSECNKTQPIEYLWKYNLQTKLIINQRNELCLAVDAAVNELNLSKCDAKNMLMKWEFGNINSTAYQ